VGGPVIDERLEAAVVRAVGSRTVAGQPVSGGYTATRRGVVRLLRLPAPAG